MPVRSKKDVDNRTLKYAPRPPEAEDIAHAAREDIIRKREEDFFRELAGNTIGRSSHPLSHMIASQQKLNSIGLPSHQLDPGIARRNEVSKAAKSPYNKPQTLVEYIGNVANQTSKAKPSCKGHPHVQRKKRCVGDQPGHHGCQECLPSSATRHRQFLSKTLTTVHHQLGSTHRVSLAVNGDKHFPGEQRHVLQGMSIIPRSSI